MCHSVRSPGNPNSEQSEKSGQTEDPGDRHEVVAEDIAFVAQLRYITLARFLERRTEW